MTPPVHAGPTASQHRPQPQATHPQLHAVQEQPRTVTARVRVQEQEQVPEWVPALATALRLLRTQWTVTMPQQEQGLLLGRGLGREREQKLAQE